MKRILKYIVIATLGLSVSCSDFFEPDNSSVIFEGDENKLATDVNASLLGIYHQMQSLIDPLILMGELRADMMDVNDKAPVELSEISALNFRKSNQYLDVRPYYNIVTSCDELLAKLQNVAFTDPKFTPEVRKDFEAETVGVRTWVLWQIAQIYGEIHVQNEVQSIETAVPLLINDLKAVDGNFKLTSLSADWVRARCNKWGVKALLGELYMYQRDFAAASTLYEQIMDESGDHIFKLTNTFETSKWQTIFLRFSSAEQELIWGIDYNAVYKQKNHLQLFAKNFLASTMITQSLFTGDGNRAPSTFNGQTINKYTIAVNQATPITEYVDATPMLLYRAADIHLRYAECQNHLNKHWIALQYINTGDVMKYAEAKGVRGRVGLGRIEEKLEIAPADSLQVIDLLILDERGRELAFEGKRWADLVRFDGYYPAKNILKTQLQKKRPMISVSNNIYVKFE